MAGATKYSAYYRENNKWICIDALKVLEIVHRSSAEYRSFQQRFYTGTGERLYEYPDEISSTVFFNKRTKSFHYHGDPSDEIIRRDPTMTASHYLRQQYVCNQKVLRLLLTKEKGRISSLCQILVKKAYPEELIDVPNHARAKKIRPDIVIKFDKPVDLALKWKNTLIIEVVESNPLTDEHLKIYKALGYGLVTLVDKKPFKELSKKKYTDCTDADIRCVQRIYKDHIKGILMHDPTSEEFLSREESHYFKAFERQKAISIELRAKYHQLKDKNDELKDKNDKIRETHQLELSKYRHTEKTNINKIQELENKTAYFELRLKKFHESFRQWQEGQSVLKQVMLKGRTMKKLEEIVMAFFHNK